MAHPPPEDTFARKDLETAASGGVGLHRLHGVVLRLSGRGGAGAEESGQDGLHGVARGPVGEGGAVRQAHRAALGAHRQGLATAHQGRAHR